MRKGRLKYGLAKYAAYNLLIARWIRLHARSTPYQYVTLGGTEFGDVQHLSAIDRLLTDGICSYEQESERYTMADKRSGELSDFDLSIHLHSGSLFDYQRQSDSPHLFFIDLEGIFAFADYSQKLGEMFIDEHILEGDCILVTSYLGRNPGWEKIYNEFDGEYRLLGISQTEEKQQRYKRSHPSFTMYRALAKEDLCSELLVKCFGSIKYRDTSPMGLYGFTVESGATDFRSMILDDQAIMFDVNDGYVA
jgi:hypothetical protein